MTAPHVRCSAMGRTLCHAVPDVSGSFLSVLVLRLTQPERQVRRLTLGALAVLVLLGELMPIAPTIFGSTVFSG